MINFSINNSYQNKTIIKAVKSDDIKELPYLRKSYIVFRIIYKEIFLNSRTHYYFLNNTSLILLNRKQKKFYIEI